MAVPGIGGDAAALRERLEGLYRTFDVSYLSSDPLLFVHRYGDDGDREVVGLIASSFAYGRVEGIKRTLEKVFGVMGRSPLDFAMSFSPGSGAGPFGQINHRFNTGEDAACLVYFIRQMIEESGSIGAFFRKGYRKGGEGAMKKALTNFSKAALALDPGRIYGTSGLPEGAGVRFFFPSPADGSPCKRLNLFLRWMVRRGDGLDFGIWKKVSPSDLIIPLDTHIARISRNIGLTRRKSPDWKMAEEVTARLRELDPSDPVKYDFSLCRLGILEHCPSTRDLEKCEKCMVREICVL